MVEGCFFAVIVRVPDEELPGLEASAACYAKKCEPEMVWDWEFASSNEAMFLFSNNTAADVFASLCRLRGLCCKRWIKP